MSNPQVHYRSCNLCEAICGLKITHENGKVLSIKGDPDDPLSKGHICPKAVALQDIYEDPNRLKTPVRKTADGWESISWEEAYDEVTERLKAIREKYGANSIGVYQGNPNVHNLGTILFGPDFIRSIGTKNRFSATSADQLPHQVVALLLFGHVSMVPVADIDHTDFLLMLGANPLVSNGSMMTAPDFANRIKGVRERGGKVVLIDPRRTETAKKVDEHWFVYPGRDVLLLLALIHTIFDEGLVQLGPLEKHINGLPEIEKMVREYSPEKVAQYLDQEAPQLRQLARDFAKAPSAVCYGRFGVSTQAFGGLCQWLIVILNTITGNLDRRGGAMFTAPAFDHVGMTASQGRTGIFGRRHSRVSGLPDFSGEFPVAALLEEMQTPGEGQIKAMVTSAGNPVLSVPNGTALAEAFENLEFMVSVDIYINETTCHADIILPPTTGLETSHYDIFFHGLAVRNTSKFSTPLFDKTSEQRHDWQIFKALTGRMTGRPDNGLTPEQMLQFGLEASPYNISVDQLKANPSGIDIGPLQPSLPDRLFTKDRSINLALDNFLEDLNRVKETFFESANGNGSQSFALIGRRQLRSNNSWMHNSYRLVKGKDRCTLLVHPQDAESLNIQDGQEVKVRSRVGQIVIKAEVSDEIMPGVVSIPHGWGHDRKGVEMEVAKAHAGVSVNDLTDEKLIDPLTGNIAFSGVPVYIEA